ncbi:uncharacterized protein E0L32_003994 [Thyridium curvatum]|uniref:Amidase domain-containing protein n=1 Tax=Thyridium curvatum TaxID=1093900 RepID=A0A507AZS4_9PEZI|nr:uncharacterized protein E0L32_003994 [Thyridium curvatum]TPX16345.1 hypothetical protein E0L32_003994 [Thyridium curvatum]
MHLEHQSNGVCKSPDPASQTGGEGDKNTVRSLRRKPKGQGETPERFALPRLNGHDLFEVTISELQRHYTEGHFTATDYVSHCLNYLLIVNPYIEAVIEMNPDAISIAEKLDQERSNGHIRGPMHGVPVLVKDTMATKDKMQTTAGSWALLGSIVPRDAFVVKRLRDAGAIILGHSNMSEWSCLRSKSFSNGYSPRGGQCRNPYNLKRSPAGSSSGSAAAVSANIVPLALGAETDTSIIGPAGMNGVVGIKPTVGLTSRSGVIPISINLDSVGPLGRTVSDAVAGLDVMAAPDEEDSFTTVPERTQPKSYLSYISTMDVLKGARFGLPLKGCWNLVDPAGKKVAASVLDAMKRAGAEIVEVDFPSVEERVNEEAGWNWEHGEPSTSEWTVTKIDAYNDMNKYFATLEGGVVHSVEDLIQYNKDNSGTEGAGPGDVPAFMDGQTNLEEIAQSKGIKDETYYAALKHIRSQTRENGIDAALTYRDPETGETSQLDALIFCDRAGIGQQYAAQAGYPVMCIPIGVDDDMMPVSLSVQHSAWREPDIIKWASAIEDLWNREKGWRTTPTFKNLHAKNIPVLKV